MCIRDRLELCEAALPAFRKQLRYVYRGHAACGCARGGPSPSASAMSVRRRSRALRSGPETWPSRAAPRRCWRLLQAALSCWAWCRRSR
eukprot:5001778-Alexandrium_andersonii.AAC.1